MRIHLLFIGKPRDEHSNAIAREFIKRAGRYIDCDMREIDPRKTDLWTRPWRRLLLDPGGDRMDSAGFTAIVEKLEFEGRDAAFVVGGADGFSDDWKQRADRLISLSPMTFPHELARAMLAEQIYRAAAGLRGHPYPR